MKLIEIADYLQWYKTIEIDRKKIEKLKRGKVQIKAYKVKSEYDIYISDKVKIKKKQFHSIQGNINKTLKLLQIGNDLNLPKFIIVTTDEMQTNTIASYNAIKNTILINEVMGIRKELIEIQRNYAKPYSMISTLVHELIHYQRAKNYENKYGKITVDNYHKYIKYLNLNAKKELDKLEQRGYNINEISGYALLSLKDNNYDEAYVEYVTKTLLGGK